MIFDVIESPARDCSEMEEHSINAEAECQKAASELGLYYGQNGSWSTLPKGCFSYSNAAFWNTHETGDSSENRFPICKKGQYHNHCY